MPTITDDPTANSGIKTSADGASYIPSSQRADGTTRKEIRIRSGYRPPEDVATYKNRYAEAWKTKGTGGIPGADSTSASDIISEQKGKNAKRREAARRKAQENHAVDSQLSGAMEAHTISEQERLLEDWQNPGKLLSNESPTESLETDRQKKLRNQLKKLKGIRELKAKKAIGDKMSPDQLLKISKEAELLRDLRKLGYDGPESLGNSGEDVIACEEMDEKGHG